MFDEKHSLFVNTLLEVATMARSSAYIADLIVYVPLLIQCSLVALKRSSICSVCDLKGTLQRTAQL